MTAIMQLIAKFCFALAVSMLGTASSWAACNVSSVSTTALDVSTYTNASGVNKTVAITVTITFSGNRNDCLTSAGLAFKRTTTPGVLTQTSPSGTFNYDIKNTGSASILYTTSPGATATVTGSIPPANSTSYTMTGTVVLTAAAGQSPPNGTAYADIGVTPILFNGATAINTAGSVTVTGAVSNARSCTIGGSATPTGGTATIPVSSLGIVTTSPITPTLPLGTAVTCTGAGAVVIDLSTLNSGVLGPSNSNPSFTNKIHYSATASVAGGTAATINTSTGSPVQGTAGGTSGALSVSITPIAPTLPLISGSYSDVLSIRITPQ